MAKTALLVSYQPTTRIVVNVPEGMTVKEYVDTIKGLDTVHSLASEKMKANIGDYLSIENMDIEEDKECPYGSFNDEK